ncbi:MAG: hypothetical protein QMD85_01450 [Candidatus Aenigmarchaeota archaeon]|nr:hypothetical protein [Candidatus Aenigmarchaeota archaeon]MDI6722204.1 hypothetical protein [Candidatus Aenigmarchaeota archaeon]
MAEGHFSGYEMERLVEIYGSVEGVMKRYDICSIFYEMSIEKTLLKSCEADKKELFLMIHDLHDLCSARNRSR